jgi:tRNA uridine 5-carbamoylmethylation protein Kti12
MEINKDIIDYILDNVEATHYHLALLVKKVFESQYCVTTDNNKDKWFKFNGTHWKTSNGIIHELKNKLSIEIAPLIVEARRTIREKLQNANTDQNFIDSHMKKMLYIETMLYNTSHKSNIVKECESIMYREHLP